MVLPSFHSLRHAFRQFSQNGGRDATAARVGCKTHTFCSLANVSDFFECDPLHSHIEAREKDAALRLALTQLDPEFTSESKLSLQRFFRSRRAPVISTGSLKLDLALGIGGLPKGRMVEIYGMEASGKTTLALHIIKEAQKHGGFCAYLDAENALDPLLVESMGVNTKNLLISPPDSAEKLLSVVDTLTKSGSVDVIVVDSVAALVPQLEIDAMFGSREDRQPRIMAQALRKIQSSLCNSKTLIVFVNQVRLTSKSGGLGRRVEETCGGNALKFYSAVRMRMVRTGLLKTEDEVTGLGLSVEVVKNKLASRFEKADLGIQFGRGFRLESEVLELACEHGIICKDGATYIVGGQVFSNELAAEKYLAENNGVLDGMVTDLREKLFTRKIE